MGNKNLRDVGLKVTLPRVKILDILEKADNHHMSAEDIYRHLLEMQEDVGLATVYRVLTQFEAAGLVVRHNFAGGHSIFELNQGEHHDHLVCIRCGNVTEFLDQFIEERQDVIAAQYDFQITEHALNIYGVCKDCRQ